MTREETPAVPVPDDPGDQMPFVVLTPQRWRCCSCGGGGITGDGLTCSSCDGLGFC
ncbi:hypothetical protein ACFYSC_24320 [Streptosporangium sp. NPDC004379]|uniref:hypothetical protein n=1 Tax=Streptosporangium sp. NPDC004379 TaxID=3366189 RepID=UPI00367B67A5